MGITRVTTVVLVLTAFASGAPCAAQTALPASLSGLQLAADKTDLERFPISLEPAFSPSVLSYTAIVDATYTASVLVTPVIGPAESGQVRINDIDVRSGEPHRIALSPGANVVRIWLAPRGGGEGRVYQLTVMQQDLSRVYRANALGPGMWRIQDFGGFVSNEDMYLIEGKGRAILFDTGMGRGDLAGFVRSLTKLPVDVALTHGNRDHFLQVDQFPGSTVYMSAKDVTRLPPGLVTPRFHWIKGGDRIDIGAGRAFEVVEVPGHSLGSVVYIDAANRIAVTGDAISSGSMVYVFAPTCTALDQYLDALKGLEARVEPLDGLTLLVGHHYQERTPLSGAAGKQLITDMRTAAERVLRGELEGTPARTVRDGRITELRQATFGLAGLWYNPANLVTNPGALGFLEVRTAAGTPVIPKPIFSSYQTDYTATVPPGTTTVEIVPTAYDAKHRGIAINGTPAASGAVFRAEVGRGETVFEVAITPDRGPIRVYRLALAADSTAAEPVVTPTGVVEASAERAPDVVDPLLVKKQ